MSGGGFLSRWSRRKRGAEPRPEEAAPAPAVTHPQAPPAPPEAAGEVAPVAGAAAPDPLPRLEDLALSGDLGPFLRPGIPASLRRAALRRVWSLDPGIRDFVGPADYAWDFNAPDGVPGFALELGGDLRALLAQAIGERPAEPEARQPPGGPPTVLAEAPAPVAEPEADAAPAGPAEAVPPAAAPMAADPVPADLPDAPALPPPRAIARRHGGALPG